MAGHGARMGHLVGVLAVTAGLATLGTALAPAASAATAVEGPTTVSTSGSAGLPALVDRARAGQVRMDSAAATLPTAVDAWYADEATGRLVVEVVGTPTAVAAQALDTFDPGFVDVVGTASRVATVSDLTGGQTITNSGVRCTLGFTARRADSSVVVLTAGHCTRTAGTWAGPNRAAIGPVAASKFPSQDYGAVSVTNTAAWTPLGRVQGGPAVKGSAEAAVGAKVCHAGSTTGYRCGSVTARNVSVKFSSGDLVTGLTKTNACAEPGDSGGSYITPAGQAQGVASAASGNCSAGGVSYFQPIAPVLRALKVTLVTG